MEKPNFTPVRYVNELGGVRYQPRLPSGDKAWEVRRIRYQEYSVQTEWEPEPTQAAYYTPILFRSPSRAARVARREYTRNQRALARYRLSKKKKFREDTTNESQAVS